MLRIIGLLLLALPAVSADKIVVHASGFKEPFGFDFYRGKLLLTEFGGHRVLEIDASGKWKTIAGSGTLGKDDGVGEKASFNAPHNLVVSKDGQAYVADTVNHLVRQIDLATGKVSTIGGTQHGFGGDNGPALQAKFDQTYHVVLDGTQKNLLVCDLGNRRIRQIELATGKVHTIAGNGKKGVPVDGTVATESPLVDPRAMALDRQGRLYILERSGNALRVVEQGKIRTVVGTGEKGFSGDDGPAVKAKMNGPKFLWIDHDENVLIADTENHCVRKYVVKDQTIVRIAGTGIKGEQGVGGSPLDIQLSRPHGVAEEADGTIYISDSDNGRVLKIVK